MKRQNLKIIAVCLIFLTIVAGIVFGVLYKKMTYIQREEIIQNTSSTATAAAIQQTQKNSDLIIEKKREAMYTYEDMESDLHTLEENFGNIMTLTQIAETVDGRYVYDAAAGDKNSKNQYIVTASIHAREYITSKLVMLQLMDFLKEYQGEDVLFHVIPMVNPDGVSVSQFGEDGIKNKETAEKIKAIAAYDGKSTADREYLRQWKANANGVDLNRNFDAMWNEYKGASHPSSSRYKGEYPGSENETDALIRLTKDNPIKSTVSYHTMGNVIYWYFGQTGTLLERTKKLAERIGVSTGYKSDSDFESLDPAGYKDWALSALQIPSVTIETGYGDNPVDETQIEEIYQKNKNIFKIISEGL